MIKTLRSQSLAIAYMDEGPADAPVALLLHGWPDDAHGMAPIAMRMRRQGYRTVVPWLRGFGPTRFLFDHIIRDGRGVALAQDAIDLLDGLNITRCVVIGHDWGARAGYHLAAIAPKRLRALVTLGLGYSPNGRFETPGFAQARLWWYQWLMTTEGGSAKVREDPVGFARMQWETWSPGGWFSEADFAQTAESFLNPDWPAITLHGYRSRWQAEPVDPHYAKTQQRIEATDSLGVPTLMIVGREDGADLPERSEGKDECFTSGLRRIVLDGVGHFPAREAPDAVAEAINTFLSTFGARRSTGQVRPPREKARPAREK